MTYGLSPQLFIENGAANLAAKSAAARRSSRNYLAWHSLDPERRLALVEKALAPAANDDWRARPDPQTGEQDDPDRYGIAL